MFYFGFDAYFRVAAVTPRDLTVVLTVASGAIRLKPASSPPSSTYPFSIFSPFRLLSCLFSWRQKQSEVTFNISFAFKHLFLRPDSAL